MISKFNKKAFTLMEVLVVVAIIVVLFAIAVPNIAQQSKSLSITELDNIARSIYLSSQSELLSAKATGEIHNINIKTTTNNVVTESNETQNKPANLKYITKANATDLDIINESLLDSMSSAGDFIVEYHPVSGSVYGVFFSRESITDNNTNSYGHSDVFTNRTKENRANSELLVGYYGGYAITEEDSNKTTLDAPTIKIINEEELYAEITTTQSKLSAELLNLTITLIGESDQEVGLTTILSHSESEKYTIVLDSYNTYGGIDNKKGKQFKEWVDGTNIFEGENIRVKVQLEHKGNTAEATSKEFNSLFESKVVSGEPNSSQVDVNISYGRHLQNLNKDTSGYKFDIYEVKQTENINFGTGSLWDTTYTKETIKRDFISVDSNFKMYYGNDMYIKDITMSGENVVGIFTQLNLVTMTDLNIINPLISSTSNEAVGILAGSTSQATISDIRIYADSIDSAKTSKLTVTKTNKSSPVGGFIGFVDGGTIDNCSVSLKKMNVNKANNVGTFVGELKDNITTNCYSAVENLSVSNSNVGFFIGKLTNAKISNCYTVGNLISNSETQVSGFVNDNGQNIIKNNYTAITYYDKNGNIKLPTILDSFAIQGVNTSTIKSNVYLDVGQEDTTMLLEESVLSKTYDELVDWIGFGVKATSSTPYNDNLEFLVYPFRVHTILGDKIPNHHYGSWTVFETIDTPIITVIEDINENKLYAKISLAQSNDLFKDKDFEVIVTFIGQTAEVELEPITINETKEHRVLIDSSEILKQFPDLYGTMIPYEEQIAIKAELKYIGTDVKTTPVLVISEEFSNKYVNPSIG